MVIRIQNQIFNLNFVRYLLKVDNKDGKFYIGVFTTIDEKEFYFEYPSLQRRNEDWERIDGDLSPSFNFKDISKS